MHQANDKWETKDRVKTTPVLLNPLAVTTYVKHTKALHMATVGRFFSSMRCVWCCWFFSFLLAAAAAVAVVYVSLGCSMPFCLESVCGDLNNNEMGANAANDLFAIPNWDLRNGRPREWWSENFNYESWPWPQNDNRILDWEAKNTVHCTYGIL